MGSFRNPLSHYTMQLRRMTRPSEHEHAQRVIHTQALANSSSETLAGFQHSVQLGGRRACLRSMRSGSSTRSPTEGFKNLSKVL